MLPSYWRPRICPQGMSPAHVCHQTQPTKPNQRYKSTEAGTLFLLVSRARVRILLFVPSKKGPTSVFYSTQVFCQRKQPTQKPRVARI